MSTVYLNAKVLRDEIIRCKQSFCSFVSPEYAEQTHVAETMEEAATLPVGSVVRVHQFGHVPVTDEGNRRKGKAREHIATNFRPFSHYLVTDDGLVEVGRSHWRDGLANGEFSMDHGRLTNRLGAMITLLAHRIASKPNFRSYSYRDEMEADALVLLCANILKFDETQGTSAFAYASTIVNNEFLKRLRSEAKLQSLRDDMLEDAGAAPSMKRQLENELGRWEPVKLKAKRGRKSAAHIAGQKAA